MNQDFWNLIHCLGSKSLSWLRKGRFLAISVIQLACGQVPNPEIVERYCGLSALAGTDDHANPASRNFAVIQLKYLHVIHKETKTVADC